MARTLAVEVDGTTSSFGLRKLSRSSVYGSKRRVPVDAAGRPCQAAALTRDGRFLLPPGSTATLHLDDEGNPVERAELRTPDEHHDAQGDGGQPQAADAAELLDCSIRRVYALTPVTVCEALDALLVASGVCRLPDAPPSRAEAASSGEGPASAGDVRFLVKNTVGYFLLVGGPAGLEFIGPDQADLSIPATDETWDDLDLAML
jgi:hypothetical protein